MVKVLKNTHNFFLFMSKSKPNIFFLKLKFNFKSQRAMEQRLNRYEKIDFLGEGQVNNQSIHFNPLILF
jgi:hypothetical protein